MAFLLLYLGEKRKFDEHAVRTGLSALKGTSLVPDASCLACYEYREGRDATTIRFAKDRETISLDGTGQASLSAALHVQATYPEDVHMIDEAYSFDLVLRGISSTVELQQRMEKSGGS